MHFEKNQFFIDHLIEIRKRFLKCVIFIFIIFMLLISFTKNIYNIIALPLINHMPNNSKMIAINVSSPFIIPIKLTIIVSIFISMPFILYQIWAFIAPALYINEKKLIIPLILSSCTLFYTGIAFTYFIILPIMFNFFSQSVPYGVQIATDITNYLNFVMTLFISFGISFEIPIAVVLICWSGFVNIKILKNKRPYILVLSFILGMLLSPPDIFSQTLIAIPMYLLFEIGLFFSHFYSK